MKKPIRLILALVFVAVAFTSQAQLQVAVGIKGGPNFASINADASPTQNYKNRTGFHGGAFVLLKATKIGIQPEVLFSQQGSTVQINSQNYESNFSYINVPVMIKLYTIAGINIQAGPQFGFVTNGEAPVIPDNLTNPSQITVQDVKDQMKKSDITAALGLGWDLPFGLTIDARYNMGLSKIYDRAPSAQTADARNQVFQVSLGFKLIKLGN